MKKQEILKFANEQGYDEIKKSEAWKGFDVYEPLFKGNKTAYVGLPFVILVKGEEIRMSTAEESLQIIDDMK